MSPLWPDLVSVRLGPHAVELSRRGGWPRRRELSRHHTTPAQQQGAGSADWRPAVACAFDRLDSLQWRNAKLHVELSNHFVRYACMPWVEGLGAEDTRTLARECLRSRYGEAAQTWEICLPPGSRGVPRIVAGAPMELLNALRAGGAQRQFRVSAVQPALSVMSRRGSLGSGIATGWLVQSEPGRVCLARFSGDAWQGVTSTRTGADPENELASLVEVEAVANGMSRNTAVILIEAAGDSAAAALVARGWTVRSLPSNAGRGVQ